MDRLNTPQEINEGLENIGLDPKLDENGSIIVGVGGTSQPFPVTLSVSDSVLSISCQIMKQGQAVNDEAWRDAWEIAGDLNTVISPYAIGRYTARDGQSDNEDDYPVVLVSRVPLGDFSQNELEYQIDALLRALEGSREFIQIAMGKIKIDDSDDNDGGDNPGGNVVTDHVTSPVSLGSPATAATEHQRVFRSI